MRFCSAFHAALLLGVPFAGVAASPSALSLAASSSASSSKTTSLRFLGVPPRFAACALVRLALLPAAVVVEGEAVEVEAVSSTARGGGCGAGAAALGAATGAACPSSSNRSLRGMASKSPSEWFVGREKSEISTLDLVSLSPFTLTRALVNGVRLSFAKQNIHGHLAT